MAPERVEEAEKRAEQGAGRGDHDVDRHEQDGREAERSQDGAHAEQRQAFLLGEPQHFGECAGRAHKLAARGHRERDHHQKRQCGA